MHPYDWPSKHVSNRLMFCSASKDAIESFYKWRGCAAKCFPQVPNAFTMQQHGNVQSASDAGNAASSPSIRFHTGDQKPGHTRTFSMAAPKRSRTSLVDILSIQPFVRVWKMGWTAEVLSFLFALLSLLGLVATLIAHQDKPLPDWPQLAWLNSIISLFSLMIRTGISVVLAEDLLRFAL